MQTDSFTILVGPEQSVYKVPQGRLTMHSSVFERMCSAPFLESTERVIKLPEEDPNVFEDFIDWMYSSNPHVDFNKGTEAIFELAIFAEKYQICHLKNQISDLLKRDWKYISFNSEIVDRVYNSVPEGAILRQLCSWILNMHVNRGEFFNKSREDVCKEYEPLFALHPDLGRDFFQQVVSIDFSADCKPCLFHDHSNITNPVGDSDWGCQYAYVHFVAPQSAPLSRAKGRPLKKQKR